MYHKILQNDNYQNEFEGFYFNKYCRSKRPIITKKHNLNNKKEKKKDESKEKNTMIKVNKLIKNVIFEESESPKPIITKKNLIPINLDETKYYNIIKKRNSNSAKSKKIRIN